MSTKTMTLEQRIVDAQRIVQLRAIQMQSAALSKDAGEIDVGDLEGYAARYAAAVREWQALSHYKYIHQPAITETVRGSTWVQK